MSESPEFELPLDDVDWPDKPPHADALHAALLEQTCGIVRRRARRRRLRFAASWGLAYAAGLATAWLAWPRDRGAVIRPPVQAPARVAEEQVAIAQPATVEEEALKPEDLSPEELRRRVLDAPRPEQIRLLRLAGDRYLYRRADVAAALDCYRQVIELTPRAELKQRQDDDSWLLAELKSSAAGSLAQVGGEQ